MKVSIKRFICYAMSIVMMIGIIPLETFGVESAGFNTAPECVESAEELEQAIEAGEHEIRIDDDFELDRTFFITEDTTVYADAPHLLRRANGFSGDIFVVGENKEGLSTISQGKTVVFNLGKEQTVENNLLTIDGNRNNMDISVNGTVIFVCNGSTVNVFDDICIKDCYKDGNERSLYSRYALSHPERIGGAVAIVAGGSLNLYGGQYINNSVNDTGDEDAVSYCGGAFFNYSNMRLYGGVISNSSASRGGAIYNYRMLRLYNGEITECSASSYGGAVYQADSQFAETLICTSYSGYGLNKESEFLFSNNHATNSGGAIFSQSLTALLINEGAIFSQNYAETSNGGAIYSAGSLTISNADFNDNSAFSKGGAIYIVNSNPGLTTRFSDIRDSSFSGNTANRGGALTLLAAEKEYENGGIGYIQNCVFVKNKAVDPTEDNSGEDMHGGAIYLGRKSSLELSNCSFAENSAVNNGGAIYSSQSSLVISDGSFSNNISYAAENADAKRYGGGAVYSTGSQVSIIESNFSHNMSENNGGALAAYSESNMYLQQIQADNNAAGVYGGAIYISNSMLKDNGSLLKENSATEKGGGAIACLTSSETSLTGTKMIDNTTENNGGAIFVYTGGTQLDLNSVLFSSNNAEKFGGAIYASSASIIKARNVEANDNHAGSGGFLYETTTGTDVTLYSLKVYNNSADSGPIIFGNTTKATLTINKEQYKDIAQEDLTEDYWETAIFNKLTVLETRENGEIVEPDVNPPRPPEQSEPVNVIFELAEGVPNNGYINDVYDSLPILNHDSNFMSRGTKTFDDINNSTVLVDTFAVHVNEKANNPNVGEGILIYQAMDYKRKHPMEDVSIDITSFHFSVQCAVCVNRNSRYFGYMRQLSGVQYDEFGFVRISYLLVSAAKMGIHVNVIGQIDGYPVTEGEPNFHDYFVNYLDDYCDPAYAEGKVIGNYLRFHHVEWASYGDEAASDMMHTKICTASHYLDKSGIEHENALWLSCINVDGILNSAANANNRLQTGIIISDHAELYRIAHNYAQLLEKYDGQEEVYVFREIANEWATEQIDLILSGQEEQIPKEEQIVYLGGDHDNVFELYFTPLGGDATSWSEKYNPMCKYIMEMWRSEDSILCIWNNVKYNVNFSLNQALQDMLVDAFHKNTSRMNRVYADLPNLPATQFDDLIIGKEIGFKAIRSYTFGTIHNKDILLSYINDDTRYYVTLCTSLNLHQGAASYQSNHILVIKETDCQPDSVFYTLANQISKGIAGESVPEAPDCVDNKYQMKLGETSANFILKNQEDNISYEVYLSDSDSEKPSGVTISLKGNRLVLQFDSVPDNEVEFYIGTIKDGITSIYRTSVTVLPYQPDNDNNSDDKNNTDTTDKENSGGGSIGGAAPSTNPVSLPSQTENGMVKTDMTNAKPGDTVTITVTPDEGYKVESVKVTSKSGKEVLVTDNGDGTYSFKMPSTGVKVEPVFVKDEDIPSADTKFVDVPEDAFFAHAVGWADQNGFTDGTDDTHFSPDNSCTRAQMVTFLWRVAGQPEPSGTENPFTDVPADEYYTKAVLWAVEKGITDGTTATTFDPYGTVSRAQSVTFLYRYCGEKTDSVTPFFDVTEDKYYYDAVLWAVANGVTDGKTDTTFAPDDDCTRAQIVTFLYRAVGQE